MNITEPVVVNNLVRADSEVAENGFRKWNKKGGEWDYFLPLRKNYNFDFVFTNPERKGTEPDFVPVLNIREDCIGIIPIDKMVEPVDFTVNVERKEG